jgi:fructokinase
VRPALLGTPAAARKRLEALVALADVVKVSDEDLEWLCPGEPVEAVARAWAATGPALVVVTRGSQGALGVTADGAHADVAAWPTRLVDTVGAGDTFTAGLTDGLARQGLLGAGTHDAIAGLTPAALAALLDRAGAAAALCCARQGADPPTLAELDAAMAG